MRYFTYSSIRGRFSALVRGFPPVARRLTFVQAFGADKVGPLQKKLILNVRPLHLVKCGRLVRSVSAVMMIAVGGQVASSSTVEQNLSAFDPSECVISPGEHAYFSLYGWVFAISRDHDFEFEMDIRLEHPDAFQQQLRDRNHPTAERWPTPLNADVPMGCPGNPIMTWKLTLEPTFEQLGVPTQIRRHPVSEEELSELTDEVRNSDGFRIRPARYSLTALSTRPLTGVYQPVVDTIEMFCGAASARIAQYLDVCYLHGDSGRYFENL